MAWNSRLMQARAICEAAANVERSGMKVEPEVMIPLVGHVEELRRPTNTGRLMGATLRKNSMNSQPSLRE